MLMSSRTKGAGEAVGSQVCKIQQSNFYTAQNPLNVEQQYHNSWRRMQIPAEARNLHQAYFGEDARKRLIHRLLRAIHTFVFSPSSYHRY